MAGGPSPTNTSPSTLSSGPFANAKFTSTASSPPKPSFAPQNSMAAEVFPTSHASHAFSTLQAPIGDRRPLEKTNMSRFALSDKEPNVETKSPLPTILLRKLPKGSDLETVKDIFLLAQDYHDCELVTSPYPEDKGFVSALVRFTTLKGAESARDKLNGKWNAAKDATIIVELVPELGAIGSRRNTADSAQARQGSISAGGIAGTLTNGRQSRYNGTFQHLEKMSPPNATPALGNGDFSGQNVFSSPTSPMKATFANRNLGKSLINNDAADDEDVLLNETIGYATGSPAVQNIPRRTTNPSVPVSQFNALSLKTNLNGMGSPPLTSFSSPRSGAPIQSVQSPASAMSAMSSMSAMSPNPMSANMNGHPGTPYAPMPPYARMNYPPANPADHNPPCNTLYVGNLPMETSEDELKAVFSKVRGYKRLCFRTKQQGPMCFVEFEDITSATKALFNLYGYMLSNSVKGGIRLSFSKNPLGVRSNHLANVVPPSATPPTNTMHGLGNNVPVPPGFSAATGPPPGLSTPPGLTPGYSNGSSGFGMYSNGAMGMGPNDMAGPTRTQPMSGAHFSASTFGGLNSNYAYQSR
ncbi:uncharacterized protein EI97DRAFT_181027 [Westerdykella ornata]|uniref:RRM domain-containing protein n=1 Tax=Westerdykella ornata TaxID=318751 RepID=A0A6A6JSK5_WESOR|nr:uncharacterized protein EI97DRAFT_181027 [Westerdykella ornata]KAF2279591.1 hypothetical protein EI97DRAFT_181027 [Westerdykella ornata]